MFELEADMKYSNLTFEFAKRSIKLIPTRSYTCPPHQCKSIKMKLIDCPPDFHSGTVVAKMITSREDKLPQTVRLNIVNSNRLRKKVTSVLLKEDLLVKWDILINKLFLKIKLDTRSYIFS